MSLTGGSVFAGYRIERLLGSGGMGEVYLARHPRLPRWDALKVLPRAVSHDPTFRERFIREADLTAALWHPHIVGVHDRGEHEGQFWIAMDFVDGTDAAHLLVERYPGGMPVQRVAEIVGAVADALDHAHSRGLLHRDVKPANVMISHPDADGRQRILLGDFGIARNVDDASGLTATNTAIGTVAYCAPEQLMGDAIDGRADQYALAATAYHLLTGSHLFVHSNPAVVISRHLNSPAPQLSDSHPELAELDEALGRALAKNPADRYPRCTDLARALTRSTAAAPGAAAVAPTAATPIPPSRPTPPTASAVPTTQAPVGYPSAPSLPPRPPVQAPPSGNHRGRGGRTLTFSAVGAVVLLLVATLLAWRPWDDGATDTARQSSPRSTAAVPIDDGAPATGVLRISNWPMYMADGLIADFEAETGITVDYREDLNDNEQWFARIEEPLHQDRDIGTDLAIPTTFIGQRLESLGFLDPIRQGRVPNLANLRPELRGSTGDGAAQYLAPYLSGMVGLAYNRALTGRDITSVDDLWDPAFRGRVSLLSDLQDGLGMIMLAQGASVSEPTSAAVQRAADLMAAQKAAGQIRRFTGNDYAEDLVSGNVVIAQAYSGDIAQLAADHPDLRFVVPQTGGTEFVDSMIIPKTSENPAAAEAWINFIYDRANYAELVAYTQFTPVLTDITTELERVDPRAAANPLVNPPKDVVGRLRIWAPLTTQQVQDFSRIYTAITGS